MFSTELNPNVFAVPVAAVVLLAAIWAERIHARRSAAVAWLAFGPKGAPRAWTRIAAPLRIVAATALAWGLTIFAVSPIAPLDPTGNTTDEIAPQDLQRVILLLDVSPSMAIKDAGPSKDLERRARVLEVVEGIFPRISLGRTRFSVIGFFSVARPIVVDAYDTAVVKNVLGNSTLVWALTPENSDGVASTNVIAGLNAAADMARDWTPKSTTLILCTDGDTVDFSRIPKLPSSIHQVQIYAVGDPIVGTFIAGHDSRQKVEILRRLASEMGGAYYDVNTRHVPTSALAQLAITPPPPARRGLSWKDLALIAVVVGAASLALLPLALEYFGSDWNADRELPPPRRSDDDDEEPSLAPSQARPRERVKEAAV